MACIAFYLFWSTVIGVLIYLYVRLDHIRHHHDKENTDETV